MYLKFKVLAAGSSCTVARTLDHLLFKFFYKFYKFQVKVTKGIKHCEISATVSCEETSDESDCVQSACACMQQLVYIEHGRS